MSREVETLRRRQNPNIIPLLTSYTAETVETDTYVKMLHLLFPLADMNLAELMMMSEVPVKVGASRQDRQMFLYRSMFALASGVSYLHREIDGMATSHHDLKPRNIVVFNDQLKIADFGYSHLRHLDEGSATEGASGLGTYEYRPPEYFNQDGSKAEVGHGRQFDIWGLGCIILEMATLIVDDWQTQMVTEFRNQRRANRRMDRDVPQSDSDDYSFHNNTSVVEAWIERLRRCDGSQQLDKVLGVVVKMLAPEPHNRLLAWEAELDLLETLKSLDPSLPDRTGDLCVPPRTSEIDDMESWRFWGHESSYHTETPLHRAARSNNRTRIIRLWELGWPIWFPDRGKGNGRTPLDIMKRSEDDAIQELERDSRQLIPSARDGDREQLEKLFSRGLSPLMADASGTSALHEAIRSSKIRMVDFLLQSKAKEQLMLRERLRASLNLPLHNAARLGFVAALERMKKDQPDINAPNNCGYTALFLAALEGHLEAVEWLIKNKAELLPSEHKGTITLTPLHAAVYNPRSFASFYSVARQPELPSTVARVDILNLLLDMDGAHECLERFDECDSTPLRVAVWNGCFNLFQVLLQHGASVHTSQADETLLHMIAVHNRPETLKLCIDRFSMEDFKVGLPRIQSSTPLEMAQKYGHDEVAQLMKGRIRELRRSAGDESGSWRKFAVFERLKTLKTLLVSCFGVVGFFICCFFSLVLCLFSLFVLFFFFFSHTA